MNRRLVLVVLLVVSTAAFVVGVSVERSSGDSHDEPAATAESSEAADSGEEPADERAEGEASETGDEAHMVTDGNTVVGRFACSATHLGEWRGHPPTGRRFEDVDEVYFFTFEGGRISAVWGVEDTLERFRQLGLDPSPP